MHDDDTLPTYHTEHEYGLLPESLIHWVRSDAGYALDGCGDCGVILYTTPAAHRLPNGGKIYLCTDCTKEQQNHER